MRLRTAIELHAYGTSEGVTKSWDTRGRGRKQLLVGDNAPAKDKPVVMVFGGSFNPPHVGHVGAAQDAAAMMQHAGYNVAKVLIAPTADKLLQKKLGQRMYPLADRVEMTKRTFPSNMQVVSGPAEEAEQEQGKLRRTQLADWAQRQYPGHTIVNVTGEDAVPDGAPKQSPALFEGAGNHKGYYYMSVERPPTSHSSTQIREQLAGNRPVTGMTPEAEQYLRTFLQKNPHIKLVASASFRRYQCSVRG